MREEKWQMALTMALGPITAPSHINQHIKPINHTVRYSYRWYVADFKSEISLEEGVIASESKHDFDVPKSAAPKVRSIFWNLSATV